jgi:hypothetical protein
VPSARAAASHHCYLRNAARAGDEKLSNTDCSDDEARREEGMSRLRPQENIIFLYLPFLLVLLRAI